MNKSQTAHTGFAAAYGSALECPNCQSELDHNDIFGNLDHYLNAIEKL